MNAEDRDYLGLIEARNDPDADKRWLIARLEAEAEENERLQRSYDEWRGKVDTSDHEGMRWMEKAESAERRAQEAGALLLKLRDYFEQQRRDKNPGEEYKALMVAVNATLSPQAEPQEAKQ